MNLKSEICAMCMGLWWIRSRRHDLYRGIAKLTGSEQEIRTVRFLNTDIGN